MSTLRCGLLLLVALLAGCGGGGGGGSEQSVPGDPGLESPARPNLLIIMADDLGYNDLGSSGGNTLGDTPRLDAFARQSLRFTRHYAYSTCSPARVALLTGRHPERLGFLPNGRGISAEFDTLAARLQAAGYTTSHIGK
ncbi:MAG: sulfatase-like hydrolase/transferase [Halioglobus sp.]|nr:sulfatase-like hydrolase/transferase [Halioglobus sp.]